MRTRTATLRSLLCLVLLPIHLLAFDPAKDVRVRVEAGRLLLSCPAGAHLKQRGFKVVLRSAGRLAVGPLPPATDRDEAGDPIWRGPVAVPLRGEDLADPVELSVTFQPCTEGEGGVCYLPQHRTVQAKAADLVH